MARVLICEPSAAVSTLVAGIVRGLGHEPVLHDPSAGGDVPDADVLLLEPESDGVFACARAARRRDPKLPIVFASIRAPGQEALAFEPVAYLVKPFAIGELEEALDRALSSRA